VVNPVLRYSQPAGRRDDALAEPTRPADIYVSFCEVRHEMSEFSGTETHLVARADDLMEATSSLVDESDDFVTVDEIARF
jgi:hypothetical protein